MRLVLTAAVLLFGLAAPALAGQEAQAPQGQPAAPAPKAAAAPQPPRPFPDGAKVAYFYIQAVAGSTKDGQAASSKVKALQDKKLAELNERQKALQVAQERLQKEGAVLSESARGQLEKDVDRMQKDIQRFTQDAQAEVEELQRELQEEFQRKLLPIVQQMGVDKNLQMIFSAADSGLVWADSGLDLTAEVVKRMDEQSAKPSGGNQ